MAACFSCGNVCYGRLVNRQAGRQDADRLAGTMANRQEGRQEPKTNWQTGRQAVMLIALYIALKQEGRCTVCLAAL